mmetsp:Transcript_95457/g.239246  ORF Transcript_95457/g.239246 Transcript_95457/m.239246 type:complete len:258 (-) Transcript_95457:176-949(-)
MKTPTTKGVRLQAARSAAQRCARPSIVDGAWSLVAASTTAERSPNFRTAPTTAVACAAEACRFDLAKITPTRFAPAATAQSASSVFTTPQTFTTTAPGMTGKAGAIAVLAAPSCPLESRAPPMSSRIAAPGSGARINVSPIRTPLQEMSLHSATSSGVAKPLKAKTLVGAAGPNLTLNVTFSASAIWAVRFLSSSKVCKFRLLTPRTRAPASRATLSSVTVTTSTKGSKHQVRQKAIRARNLVCERIETISKTVSAP